MIAALYVETGGCYFGLDGCYFDHRVALSRHATQRRKREKSLLGCLSKRPARRGKENSCEMAGEQPWQKCGECQEVANAEPGCGAGKSTRLQSVEPGESSRKPARMACENWVQFISKAQGIHGEPAAKDVRTDAVGLRRAVAGAERGLCHLRKTGPWHEECQAALRRPLSLNRQSAWAPMSSLQYYAGVREGRSKSFKGGGGLS